MLIDTHCHLNDEAFKDNLKEVVARANSKGITKMIVIGYNKKSSFDAVRIANMFDGVYAAIGVHPSDVLKEDDNLDWIYELAKDKKVIAIGEIGLDYYWDKSYNDLQIEWFIKQIEIAKELDLPICVHSRDASQDCFDVIKKYGNSKGVIHCYSGSLEMAKEYVKLGYYLGIGGVVTFKNSHLGETIKNIGIDHLVSETDAPYLAPVPYRGKTNEPAYIYEIVQKISEELNIDIDKVEKKIEENTYKLFKI
ncbi:MAG: TatD family hydrolase [Bacilli bacterium]|nr:TatD family hydrolase [Bacilli bacterium]